MKKSKIEPNCKLVQFVETLPRFNQLTIWLKHDNLTIYKFFYGLVSQYLERDKEFMDIVNKIERDMDVIRVERVKEIVVPKLEDELLAEIVYEYDSNSTEKFTAEEMEEIYSVLEGDLKY